MTSIEKPKCGPWSQNLANELRKLADEIERKDVYIQFSRGVSDIVPRGGLAKFRISLSGVRLLRACPIASPVPKPPPTGEEIYRIEPTRKANGRE